MNALLAIAIILFVYAIGDIIAVKTKAILSMLIVGSLIFMIAFWCGLPATIFSDSTLTAFSRITIGMFLLHIGTTIKIRDFIDQWKTGVLVLCTTVAICFGVYFIGSLIIDRVYALASGPVVGGGFVAFMIMQGVGKVLNRSDVIVFTVLVLTFQSFVGLPVSSILCKKEAIRLRELIRKGALTSLNKVEVSVKKSFQVPSIPEKYNSPNLILFKLSLIAYVSSRLADVIGVNQLIICLIFGVILCAVGLLDENALTKANAFGFVFVAAFSTIFASLAKTTPSLILSMLLPMVTVITIGVVICFIVSILVGNIFKFSWYMSVALTITALFGFPGTYLVSKEVCSTIGETDLERQILLDNIMPKMIISGIVSVSVVSGLVAGVMVNWI